MSRYIASRAIRGAHLLVNEADDLLNQAIAEVGPDAPVAFPNTAYYLPTINGMMGLQVETLGQLEPVLKHARDLLHPMPSDSRWMPYLGETLDSGMATFFAAEAIEAVRFVRGDEPQRIPGFHMTGGSFTSPDAGVNSNGQMVTSTAPSTTCSFARWGIALVDGRMPGFAAIVGAAKSNEVAVKIVRELQRRNILIFLSGNVNGRSIIHQLQEEGVEMGYDTYIVPFGLDTLQRDLRAGLRHPLRADLRRPEGRPGARDPALQPGTRLCLCAGAGRDRRPEVRGSSRRDQLRLPRHRRHRYPADPADRRDATRARGALCRSTRSTARTTWSGPRSWCRRPSRRAASRSS